MANNYLKLPLFSEADYNYSVNLQNESYILDFKYNERVGLYFLSLYTADNLPIVEGHALIPNYPIFLDYAIFPLTGYFWMEEIADIVSEPYKTYPDKIDQYYNFYYRWTTVEG